MLLELNQHILEDGQANQAYFESLKNVCYKLCGVSVGQKNLKRSNKMKSIIQYMNDNFRNTNMGLSMVSSEFNLSEGYLSVLFKEEMKINFADYLEKIRIQEACKLLKHNELITDIAEQTGYNSVQSFRRAFKRVMHVSPSEYRDAD